MKNYLVTGINSGLGKYLAFHLSDGKGLHRYNFNEISSNEYDVIIHCAFNKTNKIDGLLGHYQYLNDNIFLTQKLLELKHSHFIYISSIDVYNGNNNYSLFKRFVESIVIRKDNTTILRCPMMIGRTMKPNHITKMLCENNETLTLSGESTFNYILYKDILKFIQNKNYEEIDGLYDFISTDNVKLKDIKKEFKSTVKFGNYVYETPDNFINPFYTNRTSIETIKEYFK